LGEPVTDMLINGTAAAIETTLSWPADDKFERFDGGAVTGYIRRQYRLADGRVAVTLTGNQVTWGYEPRDVIVHRQGSGGGGGAPACPVPGAATVQAPISVGALPAAIVLDADGNAWVANENPDNVHKIAPDG